MPELFLTLRQIASGFNARYWGTVFPFLCTFNTVATMSSEQTAEEARQEYLAAMGTELGGVFFELRKECVMLHWKWQEFVALFGTKASVSGLRCG